jgi:hypothetical protein
MAGDWGARLEMRHQALHAEAAGVVETAEQAGGVAV